MDSKTKNFVIHQLRRASYKFGERTKAVRAATVDRGMRLCACCGKTKHYKDTQVDHIIPVVGPEGFTTWDNYIERMFCPAENYQVLCTQCHVVKSSIESGIRKQYRDTEKNKKRKVPNVKKCKASNTKYRRSRRK